MATTDPETVVPEGDLHDHHQAVEKKTREEETPNEVMIPSSNELETAPTEDNKLEVPVDTASNEVEAPAPDLLDAAGEQAQVKPETIAAEQVQDKAASDLEAAGIEISPTLEPVHREPGEVVEEGEVKEAMEEEAEEKTEAVEVESELKEVPALEPKESAEIETIEKCKNEAINPTTTEAADDRVQNVEDVPVQDSALEIKINDQVGEPQENKYVAEEVADIQAEKNGTPTTPPKSVAPETCVPVVEAETHIKEAAENTEAEEVNNAARANVAVEEEIAKGEKDVISEGQKDEIVPKAEEFVPTETNNGFDRGETEGKLKDVTVVPEGKHENDVNVEGLAPSQGDKLFEREQVSRDLEVVKEEEEAKELEENTGTIEPEVGSKDSQLETKVEETMKNVANEYEPAKATAEAAKPNPSTMEASKDVGDDTKATRDIPTIEVVKSTHKSSGNIMSKLKQSLVKVKKAIIGKSPSSKTSTTE